MVVLGEPNMKPHFCISDPIISVGNNNDGANNTKEENFVNHTISGSVAQHNSVQHKNVVLYLNLNLDLVL
jgi:hypothetical protein